MPLRGLLLLSLACRTLTADATITFDRIDTVSVGNLDRERQQLELTQHSAVVQWRLQNYSKNASLYALRGVVTPDEAAAIIRAMPIEVNVDEDSVDVGAVYSAALLARSTARHYWRGLQCGTIGAVLRGTIGAVYSAALLARSTVRHYWRGLARHYWRGLQFGTIGAVLHGAASHGTYARTCAGRRV